MGTGRRTWSSYRVESMSVLAKLKVFSRLILQLRIFVYVETLVRATLSVLSYRDRLTWTPYLLNLDFVSFAGRNKLLLIILRQLILTAVSKGCRSSRFLAQCF